MRHSIYNELFASLSLAGRLKVLIARFSILAVILTVIAINGSAVSPGAPDLTFGTMLGVSRSAVNNRRAIAIQSDGKILLAGDDGTCDNYQPNCNLNFTLTRYTANGIQDNTFGFNGIIFTDFLAPQNETAYDIAVQADGKIVIAGSTPFNSTSEVTGFKLIRYMPNGSLDASFGSSGKDYLSFDEAPSYAQTMLVQPDGKIVVAGSDRNSILFIARFNTDGSLDTNFGASGKIAALNFNVNRVKIVRQSDGKIVVAATKLSDDVPVNTAKLIRYNANGTLDTGFGSGGVVTSTFDGAFEPAVVIQADGKILLSGDYYASGLDTPPLRRFNTDGSVDTSLVPEVGPTINGACTNCTQSVRKILLLPDNKFYLVGYNRRIGNNGTYFLSVSRYLSNGAFDTSFGFRGTSYFRFENDIFYSDFPADAALQADGKIVIAGPGSYFVNNVEFATNYIMRINTTVTPGSVRSDFDGDGKTDFSVFRPSDRTWYVLNSRDNSSLAARYGLSTDTIAPGDYNYNRQTNFSVFRPNSGWYVAQEQTGEVDFSVNNFGQNGDVSTPEDFDGDGKTDLAVFRPSNGTWYIRYSSQALQLAPLPASIQFGQNGDKPVAGDYDGDGRADIAVFRPSTGAWYILRSSDNGFVGVQFGISTDRVVPADYDGDLKTDIAVYRDGAWYILRSSDNSFFGTLFGEAADKPVPGDYDGDGKTDVAVYRPNAGSWYLLKSSNGAFVGQQWGISEDVPVPNAFVR